MQTTTTAARARAGRAVALVALLLALIGGTVVTAAPASAVATGNVTFCLRYANGTPYANKPVHLYRAGARDTSWTYTSKQGSTNSSGCATWRSLPTGFHYLTEGYWTYAVGWSGYYYDGYTGSAWLSSNGGTVTQPTGYVYGPYRLY